MSAKRHTWSEKVRPDHHHTMQRCWNCGLMKIGRHENERHWTEWRRPGGKSFQFDGTPECAPIEVPA